MAATTAIMVAQWFVLDAARNAEKKKGDYMTQLRIQKLLFFAQGSFMVVNGGERLFDDKIYHEPYGPVVVSLMDYLKKYRKDQIKTITGKDDLPIKVDFGKEKERIEKLLNFVRDGFGQFSTTQLVSMTHDDPAWKNTRDREEILPSDIMTSATTLYFKNVAR